MRFKEAKLNREYVIKDIICDSVLLHRLGELGIFIGSKITILKKSVLGQSYLIAVFGTAMALRYSVLSGVILYD